MKDKKEPVEANVVVKSGLWYIISNFAFRAIAFITTPIFARVLTKAEYGDYSNINSWASILVVLAACDIHSSIIRAKLDFEKDLERYAFSTLTLSSIITLLVYAICVAFGSSLESILGFDKKYLHIIFVYILFNEAFYSFVTLERARYKYKAFSLLTGVYVVATSVFSVILVLTLQDKLDARVYGQYVPVVLIGLVMYCLVAVKGKTVNFKYYKYAFALSLPLVPHELSLILLSSSDRIMIKQMAGAEFAAMYSIAYIMVTILAIILDSMNKAWAPWLLDSLKAKNYNIIKKTTTPYFLIFFAMVIGALIFAPEAMLILGGKKYIDAMYVVPPLAAGCMFQFTYTMYVQLEFYEKKMKTVASGTIVAAIVNIILNFIFIPRFGYVAAGYTSLVGYIVLFIIHYATICRFGYKNIFDRKPIFITLLVSLAIIPVFVALYSVSIIRYCVGVVYVGAIIWYALKNKKMLIGLVKKDLPA